MLTRSHFDMDQYERKYLEFTMKNPSLVKIFKNHSSSKKDLIIIFFLAFILFIISTTFNFFDRILIFISQHESWQMDDLIVICIFLVLALAIFIHRRSLELKKEIYEKTKTERALLNANNKLNLMYSITRHDINNQLTVLMGYLAILEKKPHDPTHDEYFKKVSTAAERISAMIQFTKEYETIGVSTPLWLDVRLLVDTVKKEATIGEIIIKNDLPAGIEIFADPLIVKVFYNLMDNAVRYGGKITNIRFVVEVHNGDHVVVCEDDGDGVLTVEKEKIFDRGFGKNTGLGLALSREILLLTGITISENGEPGKGARFEMVVPKGAYRITDVQ